MKDSREPTLTQLLCNFFLAGRSEMSICKAHEILWNEAYTVRRSDGTCPAEGGGDECNAADGRLWTAC